MSDESYPPLDITPIWKRVNETIISLVDLIPEEQMDWSPKPELHNFRGVLIHIAMARNDWMARDVKDGERTPDVLRVGQTKGGLKEQLQLSWGRLDRYLAQETKLAETYEAEHEDGNRYRNTGHWIAFHLLEHDIHHRADILHYLALLGIEHPGVGTP